MRSCRAIALLFGVLTAGALGCSLIIDLDGFTSSKVDVDEGGSVFDAPIDSSGTDAVEAGADASSDADAAVAPRCPVAGVVPAQSAAVLSTVGGDTCNPTFVLTRDNKFAGLDRTSGSVGSLAGKNVTGCVSVSFGGPVRLTGIVVRASASPSACGGTPCLAAEGGCGTGRTLSLFTGLTIEALSATGVVSLTASGEDSTVSFQDGVRDVGVAVVCREGSDRARDDVGVDFLAGVCE